jgi:heme exporter protein C
VTILKILLFVYMSVVIVLSFITPPPMSGQTWSEASRIFYYHVPQAFVAFIAFGYAMVYGIIYLRKKDLLSDGKAALAAELGTIFCVLATITGSVFAKIAWGSFWNWDPRETSILILLIIYGAYFALRQAVAQPERRAAFSAVYSIMAFVTVPFFGFVVPRIAQSLHPEDTFVSASSINIGGHVAFIFFSLLFCFLCIYIWLFNIGSRIIRLEQKQLERSYGN